MPNWRNLRGAISNASAALHTFVEAGAVAVGDVTAIQNALHPLPRRLDSVRVLLGVAADAALTIQVRSDATVLATFTVPNGDTDYEVPRGDLGQTVAAEEELNFNVTADGGAASDIEIRAVTRSA